LLALKEAHALAHTLDEPAQVCQEAQRKFLRDHLARWIGLFAERVSQISDNGAYLALARFAAEFVASDARRLGVRVEQRQLLEVLPTPFDPDFSCAACPVAEEISGEWERRCGASPH
ncbi:MAG: hypothetical protein HY259_01715, partial [Chloroflexi bacterium]|nr:hypothetical protein [Chloroflexota bacterium]